jgi:signal transduction histidine kinase
VKRLQLAARTSVRWTGILDEGFGASQRGSAFRAHQPVLTSAVGAAAGAIVTTPGSWVEGTRIMVQKPSPASGASSTPRVRAARDPFDAQLGPPAFSARLVSRLLQPTARSLTLGLMVAATLIMAETLLVYEFKQVAPGMAFGVVYLMGVLVISAGWGFGLAAMTSVASALAFDYFRQGRAGIFSIEPQDVVAITIFLVVALAANTLAGLARARTLEADQRRREADVAAERAGVLAVQQASLRRVATLVARGVASSEVFSAVARELARSLGVYNAGLLRYDTDGASVLVAATDEPGLPKMPVGERFPAEGENIAAMVFDTGRAARMDSHNNVPGPAAARIRELGLRSGVGAPIVVDGRLWGVAVVGSSRPEPLPPDTEARVTDFTDLVATAIANAETRAQLTASRARIVAAADDARRQLERDLHDGAQQRLVSLGLRLRMAGTSVPPELQPVRAQISDIAQGLAGVSEELREISRGIHPAILSKGGLGPALKTLARRSAVPVELELGVDRRLGESAEVAAYYVAAEALTNVAKHAQASVVTVRVEADDVTLRLLIRDDGIGGADLSKGSGLIGLMDRVEALGGRVRISSRAGSGTALIVEIPLEV